MHEISIFRLPISRRLRLRARGTVEAFHHDPRPLAARVGVFDLGADRAPLAGHQRDVVVAVDAPAGCGRRSSRAPPSAAPSAPAAGEVLCSSVVSSQRSPLPLGARRGFELHLGQVAERAVVAFLERRASRSSPRRVSPPRVSFSRMKCTGVRPAGILHLDGRRDAVLGAVERRRSSPTCSVPSMFRISTLRGQAASRRRRCSSPLRRCRSPGSTGCAAARRPSCAPK